MALTPVKLPDIQQSQPITRDKDGHAATWFITALNNAFKAIVNALNGVIDAQNAAEAAQVAADVAQTTGEAAQSTADTAQSTASTAATTASTAQTRADDAYTLAGTKVTKNTTSAPSYSTYTAPVVSNPPTQAEVQSIANALAAASAALNSTITKLHSADVFS